MTVRFVAGLALLVAAPAWASDCAEPYTVDAMLADLVEIEQAFRNGEDESGGAVAQRMLAGLVCFDEVIPGRMAGRVYRAVGAGLYVGGDVDGGTGWMRTSFEIDPMFSYGVQDMPAGHPVARAYEDVRKEMTVDPTPIGDALTAGTHYLDGRTLHYALATDGRPHLYQVEGDSGVKSWIIDGSAFPEAAFAAAVVETGKKGKKSRPEAETESSTTAAGVAIIERERPAGKTPLLVAGASIGVGAGVLYYVSSVSRGKFADATVEEDIYRYRSQTNTLVLASTAVFAAGAGTFAWGVALDSGGVGAGLDVRF